MMRIALALAIVAMAAVACQRAGQQQSQATDTTQTMGDTTHVMAGDTANR